MAKAAKAAREREEFSREYREALEERRRLEREVRLGCWVLLARILAFLLKPETQPARHLPASDEIYGRRF